MAILRGDGKIRFKSRLDLPIKYGKRGFERGLPRLFLKGTKEIKNLKGKIKNVRSFRIDDLKILPQKPGSDLRLLKNSPRKELVGFFLDFLIFFSTELFHKADIKLFLNNFLGRKYIKVVDFLKIEPR